MNATIRRSGEKFLAAPEAHLSLCVTDLSRTSVMEDCSFRSVWQEGMERDGSSAGFLYMDELCAVLQPHTGIYTLTSFPLTVALILTRITGQNGNATKVIE